MLAACAERGQRFQKRRGTVLMLSAAALATPLEMSGLYAPEMATPFGDPSDGLAAM